MRSAQAFAHKDRRPEKVVEHAGDLFMQALGFEIIRFSMARATMQTPGIPDRRYYSPRRKLALWWEAKAANGHQSAFQTAFQRMCEACGEIYLVGTEDVLLSFAVSRGWVERLAVAGAFRIVPTSG